MQVKQMIFAPRPGQGVVSMLSGPAVRDLPLPHRTKGTIPPSQPPESGECRFKRNFVAVRLDETKNRRPTNPGIWGMSESMPPLGRRGDRIKRRYFVLLLAGAMTGSRMLCAQQNAMPVIGYLSARSPADSANIVAAFRQGLSEAGFVDKRNVVIESRFAEGHFDRLPALATDLVRDKVNVLVATGGTVTVVKAKPVVPATIPIVFAMGGDPVKLGIVESLSRPGGNITGVSFLVNGLAAKEIELLNELVPGAAALGFLVNPKDPNAASDTAEARAAANSFRRRLVVVNASTQSEIDAAFTVIVQRKVAALFVDTEPFLADQTAKMVALAAEFKIPATSALQGFADAGGLASYGTSLTAANRELGVYTGRILKGDKPADLPVVQSTRFALIVNLKTAQALALKIPPLVLAGADKLIE